MATELNLECYEVEHVQIFSPVLRIGSTDFRKCQKLNAFLLVLSDADDQLTTCVVCQIEKRNIGLNSVDVFRLTTSQ